MTFTREICASGDLEIANDLFEAIILQSFSSDDDMIPGLPFSVP